MKDIKQELAVIKTAMQEQVPSSILEIFNQSIQDLKQLQFGEAAQVGMSFAQEIVHVTATETIALPSAYKGKKVVVSFVRGSWCPFCNVEVSHLKMHYDAIRATGAEVVVITPQQITANENWATTAALPFVVAQDKNNVLAKQLGISFELQAYAQPQYKALGIDIPANNDTQIAELVLPATFVLDEQGEIIFRYLDVDYGNRLDISTILPML